MARRPILAILTLVLLACITSTSAAASDSVKIENDPESSELGGFGMTVLQPLAEPAHSGQAPYVSMTLATPAGETLHTQVSYVASQHAYESVWFYWECTSAGAYTTTATFPDGNLVTESFSIEKQPCEFRWFMTIHHTRVGEHPEVTIEDLWAKFPGYKDHERIEFCVTTPITARRRCSRLPTRARQVIKLPASRHVGQEGDLEIGATDERKGWANASFTIRPRSGSHRVPPKRPTPPKRPAKKPTGPCLSEGFALYELRGLGCKEAQETFSAFFNGGTSGETFTNGGRPHGSLYTPVWVCEADALRRRGNCQVTGVASADASFLFQG
jgi:hypothetical protein